MDKRPECGIYAIFRAGTDECYIGQSIDVAYRAKDHFRRLRKGDHRSPRLQNAFNKYGEAAFTFIVLLSGLDPNDKIALTLYEQQFMDAHNSCFNWCPAAVSRAGCAMSMVSRAKISAAKIKQFEDPKAREICSAAQLKRFSDPIERAKLASYRKGKPSPWKGRSPSPEARAKMSAAKMGKPSARKDYKPSQETCAKLSAALKGRVSPNKGRPRTAEATQKQSDSMKAYWARRHQISSKDSCA